MKFLVDAMLPKSLAEFISGKGHDAIHTLDLPDQNHSTDNFIGQLANQEGRMVISKDSDFRHSFLINNEPSKLLIVATGNISNQELLDLFQRSLDHLISLAANHPLIILEHNRIYAVELPGS